MKRQSLIILSILFLSLLAPGAQAQKKSQNNRPDSYYLAGAVPEKDGKVYFSKQYSIPSLSQSDIMKKASSFVKEYVDDIQGGSTVLSEDSGDIKSMNHEEIIFAESAFQRDKGGIHYIMEVCAQDGACTLAIHTISFTYPDRGRFTAEEWITDKEALNKAQTKMYPGTAKWRRGTVNFFDDLTQEFQMALSSSQDEPKATTAQEKAATVAVINTPVTSQPKAPETPAVKPEPKPEPAAVAAAKPEPQAPEDKSLPLDQITSDLISSDGTLEAFSEGKQATAQMGGYLTREDGKLYLTLMFQPSQDVSFLEGKGGFQVRITDARGQKTLMECDEASLEKGSRGRPHMLIGTVKKATRE